MMTTRMGGLLDLVTACAIDYLAGVPISFECIHTPTPTISASTALKQSSASVPTGINPSGRTAAICRNDPACNCLHRCMRTYISYILRTFTLPILFGTREISGSITEYTGAVGVWRNPENRALGRRDSAGDLASDVGRGGRSESRYSVAGLRKRPVAGFLEPVGADAPCE